MFVMAHLWLDGRRCGGILRNDRVLQTTLLRTHSSPVALLASADFAVLCRPVHLPGPPNLPATIRVTALTRTNPLQRMPRNERNSRTPSADKSSAEEHVALEYCHPDDHSVMGRWELCPKRSSLGAEMLTLLRRRFHDTRCHSPDPISHMRIIFLSILCIAVGAIARRAHIKDPDRLSNFDKILGLLVHSCINERSKTMNFSSDLMLNLCKVVVVRNRVRRIHGDGKGQPFVVTINTDEDRKDLFYEFEYEVVEGVNGLRLAGFRVFCLYRKDHSTECLVQARRRVDLE